MKTIKWLITLAGKKPLLFSLAILLIAILVLGSVVINRDNKMLECEKSKEVLKVYYDKKFDSLTSVYKGKEEALNIEVKETLRSIIADYKKQLQEQKNIKQRVDSTILKNRKIIKKL